MSARRSVLLSLSVNLAEMLALGVATWLTASVALRAQTATNAADVAVAVFLLIAVVSSTRPADESHPLGYGRERFFWSLFAALGIFVGGGGLALEGAVSSLLHPSPVHSYLTAYLVLAATFAVDMCVFGITVRPVRAQAAERGIGVRTYLRRSTDPATSTVVVGGACAVLGAVTAAAGLVASELTRSTTPDTVAGGVIGVVLLVASAILLGTNRDLLSGRGVSPSMVDEMRRIVAAQPGVIDVHDLFAVVVGPASLIVNGDLTFADELDVTAVEDAIARSAAALRERWPAIDYIYLTPVSRARARLWPWRPAPVAVD